MSMDSFKFGDACGRAQKAFRDADPDDDDACSEAASALRKGLVGAAGESSGKVANRKFVLQWLAMSMAIGFTQTAGLERRIKELEAKLGIESTAASEAK